MLKKSISILIVTIFLMSTILSISVNAESLNNEGGKKIEVNEYLMLKELKAMSDDQLKSKGLKDDEIAEIKKSDYAKYIKDLNKENDSVLKGKGYTDDQIKAIRKFKGTEPEIVALAATLSIFVIPTSPTCTSTYSSVIISFSWMWSSAPFYLKTDELGVAWSDGFYTNAASSSMEITYYNGVTNNKKTIYYEKVYPGAGCSYEFPMESFDSSNNYLGWAKSASGQVKAEKNSKQVGIEIIVKYGHSYLGFSGPGIDITGAPSISFSNDTQEEASVLLHAVLDKSQTPWYWN